MMKRIAIIGYGRFGELLAQLSQKTFTIYVVEADQNRAKKALDAGHKVLSFNELNQVDYVFLAVPISTIETVLKKIAPIVNKKQVVIDLCSVKVYPVKLMKKYLPHSQILATHPMFGPDSAKEGLSGLQIAFCPITVNPDNQKVIQEFWESLGVTVAYTTPEEHDQDSVYSQAFTYSIAKIIIGMNLPDITFTTKSYNAITRVARLSAKDTEQLFHDMLFYNPYFPKMKKELEESILKTMHRLDEIEAEQREDTAKNT